ncbi:MAG: hypothetical protein QW424_01345 [Candidatus Bathyarchaeia archaeon]
MNRRIFAVFMLLGLISIADIVGRDGLAVAYGIFGILYGVSWGVGGFIITFILELSAPIAIGYTSLTQASSLLMLAVLNRQISSESLRH